MHFGGCDRDTDLPTGFDVQWTVPQATYTPTMVPVETVPIPDPLNIPLILAGLWLGGPLLFMLVSLWTNLRFAATLNR